MLESLLFRYRSGDKRTIEAFENDRLYFSTPGYFNDPFDSVAYVNYDKLLNAICYDLDNYMQESLEIRKKDLFSIVSEYNQEYLLNMSKDEKMRDQFLSRVVNTVQYVSKKITENCKIICFSEEHLSNLMWSHYANYHNGFVLAYDKDDLKAANVYNNEHEKLDNRKRLVKVNYETSMQDFSEFMYNLLPQKNEAMLQHLGPMLIRMLSSKTSEWSYEKEWRLCSMPNSLEKEDPACYINIVPRYIFVGAKMSSQARWGVVLQIKRCSILHFI